MIPCCFENKIWAKTEFFSDFAKELNFFLAFVDIGLSNFDRECKNRCFLNDPVNEMSFIWHLF